ncbi:MAG: hypothetical protein WA008_13330, partial [Saprospiraceae bacterium]
SMQHRDVREMGGEWLCYQAVKELGIDGYLKLPYLGEDHMIPISITHAKRPMGQHKYKRWLQQMELIPKLHS